MTKIRRFGSIAVLLAAGVLVGATADRAISRIDIRAMSAAQKNRQVRQDLLSILRPSETLFEGNRLDIGDVWLHTKTSATQFRTLCQRDTLQVFYAPVDKNGDAVEWLSRPYKIESYRSYRFVGTPKLEYLTEAIEHADKRSPFDRECRAADKAMDEDEWTGWFTAEDPEAAMTAGFAMLALKGWSATAANQFENCLKNPNPSQCKANFSSAVSLDRLESVVECAPHGSGEICVELGNYAIFTIHARKTGLPMRTEDIISVNAEQEIIVT